MRVVDQSEWKKYLVCCLMTVALLAALPNGAAAEHDAAWPAYTPDANDPRSAIPEIYRWDLSPLFASDEAWDEARLKLLAQIPGLEAYDGKLADPAALRACLDL